MQSFIYSKAPYFDFALNYCVLSGDGTGLTTFCPNGACVKTMTIWQVFTLLVTHSLKKKFHKHRGKENRKYDDPTVIQGVPKVLGTFQALISADL